MPFWTVDCNLCLAALARVMLEKQQIEDIKSFREEFGGIQGDKNTSVRVKLGESWDIAHQNVCLPRFGNRSLRQCDPLLFPAPHSLSTIHSSKELLLWPSSPYYSANSYNFNQPHLHQHWWPIYTFFFSTIHLTFSAFRFRLSISAVDTCRVM